MLVLLASSWHGTFLWVPLFTPPLPLPLPLYLPVLDLRNFLLGLVQRMMGERMIGERSNTGTVERPQGSDHHNTINGPLKCPRCDSTNTKFCYYNNYSLSQPRHFCKACKRYWTRGGTLRNVPVGGGCRKNKRVKKTTTSSSSPAVVPSQLSLPIPTQIDVRPTDLNPLFFDMGNLTFPSLRHRLDPNISIYDLQPQLNLNALDLGFPPTHNQNNDNYQLQQSASSSLLHDYPLFGSSFSSATAASLLVSSLKQPKKMEDYQALLHYQDLNGNLGLTKEVKVEGEANATANGNMIEWQVPCENENPFETMTHTAASTGPVDPSFMYWNGPIGIAWPDATNC